MIVPQRLALLDTSFVLALENRDDPFHERAKLLANEFNREGGVFLLHWGILLEIGDGYARVERRKKGCGLLDRMRNEEGFRIVPLTEPLLQDAMPSTGSEATRIGALPIARCSCSCDKKALPMR